MRNGKMKVYFSHPTLTFRTRTESTVMEIIESSLDPEELINPADFGLKDDLREKVRESDVVVGMAIEGKFTFLVWNELAEAEEHGADVYTIRLKNKENIGKLRKGYPAKVKKLGREESREFTGDLLKENRSSWLGLLFGNWGSRF